MVPGDGRWDHVDYSEQWRPRKLSFDEWYEVLSEVWPEARFQKALARSIKTLAKVKGDYLDRYVFKPAREALEDIPFRRMLWRGWVSDPRFWDYAFIIVDHQIAADDKDAVRAIVRQFHGEKYIDFGGEGRAEPRDAEASSAAREQAA